MAHQRGRSGSDIHSEINSRGAYDQMRHKSTAELSEELDSKIAQIRQKYAEYTKSSISNSRIREQEPRILKNNFFDEN